MNLFSPFMGGRNGDVAPDGALKLDTLTVLQIFRPTGLCWNVLDVHM